MLKTLINNQKGHGPVSFRKRDVAIFLGILVTFPISIPALVIHSKIKQKKEEKKRKEQQEQE